MNMCSRVTEDEGHVATSILQPWFISYIYIVYNIPRRIYKGDIVVALLGAKAAEGAYPQPGYLFSQDCSAKAYMSSEP